MIYAIYLASFVAIFIALWGSETRGEWSTGFSTIGGIGWLTTVILAFYNFGWKSGLLFLFITFVIAALLLNVVKILINKGE